MLEDVRLRPAAAPTGRIPGTRRLLLCGAAVGPLSFAAGLAQALTRPGYDVLRQPVSSLALGPHGWVQVLNFLVSGVLMLGLALGLDRGLRAEGRPSRWIPRTVAVWGVALLGAGVFVTDPISGYPVGEPRHGHTVHGVLHAFPFSFTLVAACVAASLGFARRFADQDRRGWAVGSLATATAVVTGFCLFGTAFVTGGGPLAIAGLLQLLTIATGWAWLAAVSLQLRHRLR